ncbi:DUF2244 domain-containing protein [Thalassobaculum sp. OXR-137]|uniref:DUF2244 domain-containing protein n=1 Tax=Thalassobaculum sp. OXR-137 TaxID=3100173 RepID=UPI002AC8EEDB|nr:DUF2244 domain-containing protein [Thalassobaculum sp. OXR-137]WPZ35553.1 DUF2244 domain-containing protein [Thalassobaculum sp. OXR-137]
MEAHAAIAGSPPEEKPVLDLVLYPHRSLSPQGFLLLMGGIAGLSFMIGLIFFLVGAWPIVGFLGLDVAVIYGAFRLNYRAARAYETIRLCGNELEVVKIDARGRRRRYVMPSAWLRVDLEARPRRTSRLTLWSRGRALEIGVFLGQEEKDGLADVLRDGLRRATLPAHLTVPDSN